MTWASFNHFSFPFTRDDARERFDDPYDGDVIRAALRLGRRAAAGAVQPQE